MHPEPVEPRPRRILSHIHRFAILAGHWFTSAAIFSFTVALALLFSNKANETVSLATAGVAVVALLAGCVVLISSRLGRAARGADTEKNPPGKSGDGIGIVVVCGIILLLTIQMIALSHFGHLR